MLSSFLGVLPILIPPLCALALSQHSHLQEVVGPESSLAPGLCLSLQRSLAGAMQDGEGCWTGLPRLNSREIDAMLRSHSSRSQGWSKGPR
jgi:hypothetical protein